MRLINFKENHPILSLLFISLISSVIIITSEHYGWLRRKQKVKQSWTYNYKNKYFSNIYSQLKQFNKHKRNSDLKSTANVIVYFVEKKFEVTELATASLDSLNKIAINASIIEVEDDNNVTHMDSMKTDSLILNIDLTK